MSPKKVLIISYYWPPAGGPGVQRWLKFVKYLPEFGIEPIVYIPENPTYPLLDEKLKEEVSPNVQIIRKPIIEPYGWIGVFSSKSKKISTGIIPNKTQQSFVERLSLWIRGNVFIPDARVLWVKPSVSFLNTYIKENQIDTIITTGPPHSLHLIGLQLKQKNQLRWIADFRDPWTTIGYHKELKLSAFAEKKHKALEKKVLNNSDLILVTSPTTKKEFQALTQKPIEVITNGYDVEKIGKQPLDEKFTLAHIGSFLSERNPKLLWQSLQELIIEDPLFSEKFELKLIGAVSTEILKSIEEFGLTNNLNNLGYVSHQVALAHQRKSQVLLIVEIDSEATQSIIPGKVFEYLVAERPIIGIGPKNSDFANIIKSTNTGYFFDYSQKEALKQQIKLYFEDYINGKLTTFPVGLQQYSRKKLTEKLAKILHDN